MVRGIHHFNVTRGIIGDAFSMGNNYRDPLFTNDEKLVRKPLNLSLSDVCGPMCTPCISRCL